MKLGLVRHFKVKHKFPRKLFLHKSEVTKWFEDYEKAEVIPVEVRLDIQFHKCYCSPLERARITAQTIYSGETEISESLAELNVLSLTNSRYPLPFLFWAIVVRRKTFSENEMTLEFRKKISELVDIICKDESKNVLIVSHAVVMMFLRKELLSRGFIGDKFRTPENGKLYLFEK